MSAYSSPSSSCRSSPFSSFSPTAGSLSPTSTAVTSPRSFGGTSPKSEKFGTTDTYTDDRKLSYTTSLSPPKEQLYYNQVASSSSPENVQFQRSSFFNPQPYLYEEESEYQQESPVNTNVKTVIPTPEPSPTSSPASANNDSASGLPPNYPRYNYSGYPPASAFYGPSNSPNAGWDEKPINPSEYKIEDWYTADGRKVECSAMHLHCATM